MKDMGSNRASREGRQAAGNSTWRRPWREVCGSFGGLGESLCVKAAARRGHAHPVNRCAEMPVLWNPDVTRNQFVTLL